MVPTCGSCPVILQEPSRKGISVFGAVNTAAGKLVTKFTDRYNVVTFLKFLCIVHRIFPTVPS